MRNKLTKLLGSTVVATVMASVALSAMPQAALAANPEGFDGFNDEPVLTETNAASNNWRYIADQGVRDVAIVDLGAIDGAITGKALRMSNAVMDQSFGNWLFSERLATPVEESVAGSEFIAEFDIKSATGLPQEGLQISVAPQSDLGDRMSFLKFIDDGDADGGIDVAFADAQNDGSFLGNVEIASDLSRTQSHHVKIVLDLYSGPSNDVAQVYIDDMTKPLAPATLGEFEGFYAPVDKPEIAVNKAKAGQAIPLKFKVQSEVATTWEDYYRHRDGETKEVDSLIFQARQPHGVPATNPGVQDSGYYIDNVATGSSASVSLPTGGVGDASGVESFRGGRRNRLDSPLRLRLTSRPRRASFLGMRTLSSTSNRRR